MVRGAGAIGVLVGGLYFVLRLPGVPLLWSARGAITMNANLALAHVVAGAGLLILAERGASRIGRAIAVAAGAFVLAIGALTLGESLLDLDLGMDRLLATELPGQPGAANPSRMAPLFGAVAMTALGAGLLALAWKRRAAVFLGVATCCIVLVPAVGFVYEIGALYSYPHSTVIAWPTVVALFALGAGLALAYRRNGVVPLLWRDDPGGILLRRMLLPAVLLPLALGFLRLQGERLGLYEWHVGTGLFAVALMLVFLALIWRSAERLSSAAADRERLERRAREAVRENEERYRTLFTSMIEGFALGEMISDEAGTPRDVRLLEMNDAFERQTGLRRSDVQGRSLREVLPHVEQHWIDTYVGVALSGKPVRFESYNRDLDRHFSLFAFSPSPGRFAVLFTDITDRERAEAALRAANEQLRAVDQRKDEFLGMLSHELRNPLAPIRTSLYILDHADPAGPQARHAREVASRQLAHLTRLVDDLLDVTRIARGKVQLRRTDVDLADLARRTGEDHRILMSDRGLELRVDSPSAAVMVSADATRIAQVVGNLLQNAAKFTPAGGHVTLTVAVEGDAAVVTVRDTGSGIEPELIGSVFEPFVQGKQTLARREGGLGLGLALVKGLVVSHGGEVGVASEGAGLGAEFVVRLPLARGAETAVAGAGTERRSTSRHRVLVVDDNKDAAETLAELVEMFGHEAEVAFDGPSALAKARASHPDVVLCDIGLPGMDGYAVARALRAEGARDVRLIAVSGYAQPEDLARATEAGFDGHIAKPPEPGSIERVLQ